MPTYRATCPDCGATMPLNVPGDLYAGCPECAFYGWVPTLTAAIGPTPRLPLSPAAPSPAPTPTTPPESFFVMGDVMGDYAGGTNMRPLAPPAPLPEGLHLPSGSTTLTVSAYDRAYFSITPDGKIIPGPDLSMDEATQAFVASLGAAFTQRITEMEAEVERLRAELANERRAQGWQRDECAQLRALAASSQAQAEQWREIVQAVAEATIRTTAEGHVLLLPATYDAFAAKGNARALLAKDERSGGDGD